MQTHIYAQFQIVAGNFKHRETRCYLIQKHALPHSSVRCSAEDPLLLRVARGEGMLRTYMLHSCPQESQYTFKVMYPSKKSNFAPVRTDAERTPVWLMRQAGRYMAEFRKYVVTPSL